MENIIMGSETELGVTTREKDWSVTGGKNRIRRFLRHLKSVLSKNSYPEDKAEEVIESANWWEEDLERDEEVPDEDKTQESETVRRLGVTGERTSNGARLYVDGSHPECSTPECRSPRELVAYEKAGVQMMRSIVDEIEKDLDVSIDLIKRNWNPASDVSYACHENYLLSRSLFEKITDSLGDFNYEQSVWIMHLMSRQIFTGSGRLNTSDDGPNLTLSQRQPFIETIFGVTTTHDRSIINKRDRPYGDHKRYGRLHVITGDSNRADMSNFLKYGTSALVLMMLEEWEEVPEVDIEDGYFVPVCPVSSFNKIKDKDSQIVTDSGFISVFEMQRMIFDMVMTWHDWRVQSGRPVRWAKSVMREWINILSLIRNNAENQLSRLLDYYIKKRIYERRYRRGASLNNLRSLDYNYHLIGEDSLFRALVKNRNVKTFIGFGEVERAKKVPPRTRAALRTALIQEFSEEMSWSSWHIVEVYHEHRRCSIEMPSPLNLSEVRSEAFEDRVKEVVESIGGGQS